MSGLEQAGVLPIRRARRDRLAAQVLSAVGAVHTSRSGRETPTLIVRSTSLGDLTAFLPFLTAIAKADPDTRLLLVSRTGNVGTALLPHWHDRVGVVDPSSHESVVAGVRGCRSTLGKIDFGRILFAPQNSEYLGGQLRRLLMTRAVAGLRPPLVGLRPERRLRSRTELESVPRDLALNQALTPFIACGIAPGATRADAIELLGITPAEAERASELVRRTGGDVSSPAVAMYVHAKDERKRWPIDRFVEVATVLTRRSGRQLWLIGGPDDVAAARYVAEALPRGRAIVLAGAADVRTTLALLPGCDLFVGNDGSATHFAALRGCPCVTVFCNWEVPGLWEPIAAPASRSLRPGWSAARAHGDYGIDRISVAHVCAAIEQLTARPTGHSIETIGPTGVTESIVDLEPRLWKADRMG